jgi:hypothetical protein
MPIGTANTTTASDISSKKATPVTTDFKCKSCKCVKQYKHYTTESIKQSLHEIKKKLLVHRKNLSSYTRRLQSAYDTRRSAADMGYVGIVVIVCFVLWIISTDITYVASTIRTKMIK